MAQQNHKTTTQPTLEAVPTSTEVAPAKPRSEIEAVAHQLEQIRPKLALTLPSQIKPEQFERVVLTAINMQPALLEADRRSLFNACHRAAQDGLLPDGREGALVIYNTKDGKGEDGRDRWIKKVQWLPMVQGIIKKLRQSGEISSISARVVYEAETRPPIDDQGKIMLDADGYPLPPRFRFVIKDGMEHLTHEPMLWGERGAPVLAYATAKFKDGTVQHEPLTMADIAKIRNSSRSKDKGPWVDWFEEMMRKSALRRLSKYLPLSSEDRRTVERDDEMTDFDTQKHQAIQDIGGAATLLGAPVEDVADTGVMATEPE